MKMGRLMNWTGVTVLAVALAASGGAARAASEKSSVVIPLIREGGDDSLSGRMDFKSNGKKSQFRLQIKNGPEDQVLKLLVGGVVEDNIQTDSKGQAKVTYAPGAASAKSRSLDFDPRGQEIEIRGNDDSPLLTSVTGGGGNPAGSTVQESVVLVPTGVQPLASGSAAFREKSGVRTFKVEVEDLVDGSYTLIVDGVARATLNVSGGRAEVEFAQPTDDPGKLPLDFDPYGKLVQVTQDATVVLTAELLAGAPGVNVCVPAETTTVLAGTGADPDASGDARLRVGDDCRVDYRVEVEDLPVGSYDLVVGGVLRGTITVTNVVGGTEGEIEFSNPLDDDGDHLLLNFDPAGATVEIKQAATVFLSATGGTANPGVCTVMDEEPDMLSSGADGDAKGKARIRQDADCDRNLRVEVEDLALGAYDLIVGGIVRGTVNVVMVGGEPVGHIEFDTDPDQPGELLLTFDPRGELVEVRQSGTLYLSVTLPH